MDARIAFRQVLGSVFNMQNYTDPNQNEEGEYIQKFTINKSL